MALADFRTGGCWLLAASVLAAASVSGCDAVFGLDDLRPPPEAGDSDGPRDARVDSPDGESDHVGRHDSGPVCINSSLGPCAGCLYHACCDQSTKCGTDSNCLPLLNCVSACPAAKKGSGEGFGSSSYTCEYTCLTMYSASAGLFGAIEGCGQMQCDTTSECDDACGACILDHCAAEAMACFGDSDCFTYLYCIGACASDDGGAACLEECSAKYSSGVARYETYSTCFTSKCQSVCG